MRLNRPSRTPVRLTTARGHFLCPGDYVRDSLSGKDYRVIETVSDSVVNVVELTLWGETGYRLAIEMRFAALAAACFLASGLATFIVRWATGDL